MDDMHVHQERAVTSYALACSTKFNPNKLPENSPSLYCENLFGVPISTTLGCAYCVRQETQHIIQYASTVTEDFIQTV